MTQITIQATILKETDKAILIQKRLKYSLNNEEVWLPKSQVSFSKTWPFEDKTEIKMPQWLAYKHNWANKPPKRFYNNGYRDYDDYEFDEFSIY